ncbi:MAG: SGNH/GDSL hydrolase family protein [Clostridia bacterium]
MNTFFKKGQTVLFQGDSITDCGRDKEDVYNLGNGYPNKVTSMYKTLFGSDVTFINKGISGNRVKDILARYDEDIKNIKPDFISILIGINDVWRRYDANDATSLEDFENSYDTLLEKIVSDFPNIKIMIIEPFLLHATEEKESWHEDLDPKIQAVRKLAMKYADYFLPLDGIMAKSACEYGPDALSADGVHPSDLGHAVITEEYLKLLGII